MGGPLYKGDIEVITVYKKRINTIREKFGLPGPEGALAGVHTKSVKKPGKSVYSVDRPQDFNGRTCIRCPWHKYCVTIDTGESLYQSIDHFNESKPPEWRSMGRKQRTHTVTVREGNIYVKLSDSSEQFASDQYNKVNSSWLDQ